MMPEMTIDTLVQHVECTPATVHMNGAFCPPYSQTPQSPECPHSTLTHVSWSQPLPSTGGTKNCAAALQESQSHSALCTHQHIPWVLLGHITCLRHMSMHSSHRARVAPSPSLDCTNCNCITLIAVVQRSNCKLAHAYATITQHLPVGYHGH